MYSPQHRKLRCVWIFLLFPLCGCELFQPRGPVDAAVEQLQRLADTINLESDAWRDEVARTAKN